MLVSSLVYNCSGVESDNRILRRIVITDFFNSNLPIINESVNLDGAQPDDDEDDAMFGSFF